MTRGASRWIATVVGVGCVPIAPGTAGSLVGVGLVVALGPDPVRIGIALLVCTGLALASISGAEQAFGRTDPQQIVIDALSGPVQAVEACGTLEDAVARANELAEPGDTVLLAPACASFDQFEDFEERGDAFKRLVMSLAEDA